jgi:hypothetical protein
MSFKQVRSVLWERHLAATGSRLEAAPTKKNVLADKVAPRALEPFLLGITPPRRGGGISKCKFGGRLV